MRRDTPIGEMIIDGFLKLDKEIMLAGLRTSLICSNMRNRTESDSSKLWHRRLGHTSRN